MERLRELGEKHLGGVQKPEGFFSTIMGKGKEQNCLLLLEFWRFVLAIFHFSRSRSMVLHLTFAISN